MMTAGPNKETTAITGSLTEHVYHQMVASLDSEIWQAGQRLPSEDELAKTFGVSRPVVRQAIGRLKAEGRLISRKGSGHFVQEASKEFGFNFGTLHSVPDVRLFLEFRCYLESEIAAQAAMRAEAKAIEKIERQHVLLKTAMTTGKPAIQEDIDFHLAIANASGNRFFISTLAALGSQVECSIRLIRELADRPLSDRMHDISDEHQRIVDAIKSRDANAARTAMADHLQGGIRRLFGQ